MLKVLADVSNPVICKTVSLQYCRIWILAYYIYQTLQESSYKLRLSAELMDSSVNDGEDSKVTRGLPE